jgi:hypothetical protein
MSRPPRELLEAMSLNWGVYVDAYLMDAAKVGDRFAATAFGDQSGVVPDGVTVATQPLRHVATQGSFKLLQTVDGGDYYVLVTEYAAGMRPDGNAN